MFRKDQPVIIHSLGPQYQDEEYKATVVGVAVKDILGPHIYIVRLDEYIPGLSFDYDYVTLTGACIKAQNE